MPNVVTEDLFSFVLNHEVLKANRLRYSLSLLCLAPDVPAEAVPAPDSSVVKQVANAVVRQLRALDLGTIVPACVAVLLIDAEPPHLGSIVQRVVQGVEESQVRAGDENRPVTLSIGAASYPGTATSAREMLQQALELMTAARRDGGDRVYLPA